MSTMPTTPEEQADFVLRTLVPFFLNDLEALVESRCPKHGGSGAAPNFSTVLISLAAIEVIASLDASVGLGPKDARREISTRLGTLVGDHRYGELGEILFVVFRHGIAHTFLPKLASDVGGVASWIVDEQSRSLCIETVRAELGRWRAESHLQLARETLWVLPQILYLDVTTLIDDYRSRLAIREGVTIARLAARFPSFWNDNATIRMDHLNAGERDLVQRRADLTPLAVITYPEESFGGRTLRRELQRTQGNWRLVFDVGAPTVTEDFSTREEADDRAVSLAAELHRWGAGHSANVQSNRGCRRRSRSPSSAVRPAKTERSQ